MEEMVVWGDVVGEANEPFKYLDVVEAQAAIAPVLSWGLAGSVWVAEVGLVAAEPIGVE